MGCLYVKRDLRDFCHQMSSDAIFFSSLVQGTVIDN